MDLRPYLRAPGIRDLTVLFMAALERTEPNGRLSDQPDLLNIIMDYLGRQTVSASVQYVEGRRGSEAVSCLCCQETDCAEYFKLVYQPGLEIKGEMVRFKTIYSFPSNKYKPRKLAVCHACARSPTAIYSIKDAGVSMEGHYEMFTAYVPDIPIERYVEKKTFWAFFEHDEKNKIKRAENADKDYYAFIQPFFMSIDGEVRKVFVSIILEMILESDPPQYSWEDMGRFCDLDEFEPRLRAELLDMSKVRTRCF